MRKTIAAVFALALAASTAAAAEIRGTWSAFAEGDHIQLNMKRETSDWGHTLPRSDFALSDAQINAPAETPVRFVFARDAGTIAFDGTFESGQGVGRFVFTPNAAYADTLRSLGVTSEKPLDDERLFRLAMSDVSADFIRAMQSLGYRETLDTYIRFRIFNISPEYVREMRALGYDALSAKDLVRFRIFGVSPEVIREFNALGYRPSAEDLVRMRIHGVTPEYIRKLAAAGYHGIPVDKLVQMRIRGITAEMLEKNQ